MKRLYKKQGKQSSEMIVDKITTNTADTFSVTEKNYETGEETIREFDNLNSTYLSELQPFEIPQSNLISPCNIIGADDRTQIEDTTIYPYSAIVYLEVKWGNEKYCATAFMISKNVAITSAHAVYNKELGGFADSIKAYPAKNGYGFWNNPYGSSKVIATGVCTQWAEYINNSEDQNAKYPEEDWGAVVLKEPLGDETGTISIKCPTGSELLNIRNDECVKICGYQEMDTILPKFYQFEAVGNISTYSSDMIYYELDTVGGQSGSPLLNDENVAIGVHFGYYNGYNCAVRMDENMMYYFNLAIEDYK